MTGPAEIVEGAPADMDAVMAIMEAAFDPAYGEAWRRGQCLGILSLPDVWLSLARVADQPAPVGFALARRVFEDAELLLLAVLPGQRGRGVGRALVERTVGEARARGAERLMLEMREGNPAHRLYDAAGFALIGRRKSYYHGAGGEVRDALTLSRPLRRQA